MRLPIAKWGWSVLLKAAIPLAIAGGALRLLGTPWWLAGGLVCLGLVPVVWFFRDPRRQVPYAPCAYLAPADGRVVDITPVDHDAFLSGPATRIGIFLSVFDVHLNRVPTDARVLELRYQPGAKHDARSKRAALENESQWIGLQRTDGQRYSVRQISGAVARRIVCPLAVGDKLSAGQRFGMIKFGSRTELTIPQTARLKIQIGDRVQAGHSVLAEQEA